MKIFRKQQRAVSTIEYVIVIVMFLTAILLMQKQIARAFFGRWKGLGDTFGQGGQYDPARTVECQRVAKRDFVGGLYGRWYFSPAFDCCMETTASSPNTSCLVGDGTQNWGVQCYGTGSIDTCKAKTGADKADCCVMNQLYDCLQQQCGGATD